MRYVIRGWMWWGRIARAIVKLIFFGLVALTAAFMLSAVLYVYFQAVGLIAK